MENFLQENRLLLIDSKQFSKVLDGFVSGITINRILQIGDFKIFFVDPTPHAPPIYTTIYNTVSKLAVTIRYNDTNSVYKSRNEDLGLAQDINNYFDIVDMTTPEVPGMTVEDCFKIVNTKSARK
jgi:hypothetical protein